MRRAAGLLLALAASGCTYTASARRVDDLPAEERVLRVVDVLDEAPAGPPRVSAARGPVPGTVALRLEGPLRARCRALVARRARQALREATVTYVPRRAGLKHGLAYSVGLAALAPVWLPLHYHGCAADEAEAALERGEGGSRLDEAGGCLVARVERAELAGAWEEAAEVVERDVERHGPWRGVVVRVRAAGGPGGAWTGRTGAAGGLVVPLRALAPAGGPPPRRLEVSGAGLAVVVDAPPGASAGDDPLDLDSLVARDGLEAVVERLARNVAAGALAPDDPAARALPALLRRRGAPLALSDAARPRVVAAARALRAPDLPAARAALEAALAAQPACWEAHRLLGLVARREGDEAAAAWHLQVAWCLLPEGSPLGDRVLAELVAR